VADRAGAVAAEVRAASLVLVAVVADKSSPEREAETRIGRRWLGTRIRRRGGSVIGAGADPDGEPGVSLGWGAGRCWLLVAAARTQASACVDCGIDGRLSMVGCAARGGRSDLWIARKGACAKH
jgi:hypothetical protein